MAISFSWLNWAIPGPSLDWLMGASFFFFCSLDRKWILNLNCFIWLFFQQDHMAYLVANIGGFLICRLFLLVLIFCWSDQFLHPYGYLFLFMPFDLFFLFDGDVDLCSVLTSLVCWLFNGTYFSWLSRVVVFLWSVSWWDIIPDRPRRGSPFLCVPLNIS